jgi:hypothetical protein
LQKIYKKNTLTAILKEIQDVPSDRLEELYQYVHSQNPKKKTTATKYKKIMSFAGAFKDMKEKDYQEYLQETKRTRNDLFDRD